MSLISRIIEAIAPIKYDSVESYAAKYEIEITALSKYVADILRQDGKVEAIKALNTVFMDAGAKSPLPLPSTYRYVSKLTES